MLRLEVRDDGPWLKTTPGAAPKPAGTGIGLSNTGPGCTSYAGRSPALELADYPAGARWCRCSSRRRAQPEPVV